MSNALPTFIIIGAMRAGTTSLYDILSHHPQISMSQQKETDFFIAEKSWSRGTGWYTRQFDPSKRIRGEASPNYTKRHVFTGVPERIYATVPNVKLIYLLRDPVARAISHIYHLQAHAPDPISDNEQVPEEMYRHLLQTSFYAWQLAPYRALFPTSQLLCLDFDRFRSAPDSVVSEVLEFVGAEPHPMPELGVKNSAQSFSGVPRLALSLGRTRLAKKIPPSQRQRIKRLFRKPVQVFEKSWEDALRLRLQDDLRKETSAYQQACNR